jgi:hypothetical protein
MFKTMKQVIKTGLIAIAGLLFTIAGYAQTNASSSQASSNIVVNVHPLPGMSKLRVIVVNPAEKKVSVIVKNKQGETFYEETIKMESFCRDLNLGELKSDRYTVEIKSKNYLYSHELSLKDKVIEKKVDMIPGTEVAIVSE